MIDPYQPPKTETKEKDCECNCVFRCHTPAWVEWSAIGALLVMAWFAGIGLETVMIQYGFKFDRTILNDWFDSFF